MNPKKRKINKMILLISGLFVLLACRFSPNPRTSGDVLFADDFSISNQNWDTWNTPGISAVSFLDEGLIMIVYKPNLDVITTNHLFYQNVSIKTLVRKRFGSNDNAFGIVCRYLNDKNYYGFLISSDGYYGIVKVINGEYTLLSSENMEYDESINKDKEENWLHAVCEETTLTLFINGEEKTSVVDSDLKTGKTGLITGSFTGSKETAVFFDDFVVAVP
ncbi:MAG: hypothetical protein Q7J07_10675 [Pelolinea sp.]|nr:hypothetical protein [Pelolinea sp.]